MRLTINLVTYNGEKYIPYLFESLRKQTYQDWELLVLDNNLNAVAVAPRLMRFSDKDLHRFMTDSRKLQISEGQIDGLGLKVMRNRRVVDKYAQKKWEDIKGKVNLSYHTKNEMMEVFGLSGAMAMYRSSVIKDVETTPGKIYDESYLSYKEDVDLAFRLRSAGCN